MTNQLAEDLRAVKAYLAGHGRCTKGAQDLKAGTCCPIVATARVVYGGEGHPASKELDARQKAALDALGYALPAEFVTVGEKTGRPFGIIEFNEHPDTTDDDVFAAFDRAIEEAEKND